MKQYVTLDKRSKKAQREYYAKQRTTWGELNPVTRSVPSGKTYNRKKEKQRIGVEFRNGFDADFLRSLVLLIHLDVYKRQLSGTADVHPRLGRNVYVATTSTLVKASLEEDVLIYETRNTVYHCPLKDMMVSP